MSLQEKVLKLRMDAVIAARHAAFWQRLITEHGETKATAFYTHLGLNHIEKKSFEWEGLPLSREPKEHEKIAIKGVHGAQESSKEQITKILLELRKELISDGLKGVKKLPVAQYHELTLTASPEIRQSLRDRLIKVYHKGRRLLDSELADQKLLAGKVSAREYMAIKDAMRDEEFELLDDLVGLTDSRVINEVQVRIAAAAARYRLLGLTGAAFWKAVEDEVRAGSVSYIDRAATGVANSVINIGRSDEAAERKDEWETVEYSAILDQNVCGPCNEDDGQSSTDEDDLTPAPNPNCVGGDWCRCMHVFIVVGG